MAFGLALPVGWESTAEYLDIRFAGEVAVSEVRENVEAALPGGLSLIEAGRAGGEGRSLAELAEVADYLVVVTEGDPSRDRPAAGQAVSEPEFWSSVAEALSRDSLVATRMRRGEEVVEDIRPMIMDIERTVIDDRYGTPAAMAEEACRVQMRLRTKPYVLRPEVVLAALGGDRLWHANLVRRTAQYWQEEGGLRSIDETIGSGESAS